MPSACCRPTTRGGDCGGVGEGDAEALAPGLGALPGATVESRWVAEAEMPALLAAADVLVMPYREASQSGVVPLAYALGLPVVATPVGGLTEQVQDGVTGALADGLTPEALAAAMARLCDPGLRARCAEGARDAGRRLSDWDAQAAALLDALAGFGIAEPAVPSVRGATARMDASNPAGKRLDPPP